MRKFRCYVNKIRNNNERFNLLSGITVTILGFLLIGILPAKTVLAVQSKPRVVMIVVNRVNFEDLIKSRFQNINRLISAGSLGLMTIYSGGDLADANAYVTIGGGDKFNGSSLTGESFNRDEILADGSSAVQAYRRNLGINPGASKVMNISLASTLNANLKRYTSSVPGQLGSSLHKQGLKTVVIGNSDLAPEDMPNRLAVTIAMDEWGLVDRGNVSTNMLKKDPGSIYGWCTDYDKVLAELGKVWSYADFIVVETGDSLRVDSSLELLTSRMAEYHRQRALAGADKFLGAFLPKINRDTMLLFVTPLPTTQMIRDGVRLAPFIAAGGMVTQGGIVSSVSTRQPGLIANNDIAATVLKHLQVQSINTLVGLPIQSFAVANPKGYVNLLYQDLTANNRQRPGVLYYFTRYQWMVLCLALLQIVFRHEQKKELARALLTGILLYPLAILLVPLTGSTVPWLTILLTLVILAFTTYLITRIGNNLKLYIAVAVATVIPSMVDVLTGEYLMKKAALSYDLVVGGRYYGIGNEYMGVIIGATILGAAALLQMLPGFRNRLMLVIGLIFTVVVIFFAVPSVGTNAGGAMAATVGFTVAFNQFLGAKTARKTLILSVLALLAGIALIAVLNYVLPVNGQSHIGRSINRLMAGNFVSIWQTIIRKLIANLYLLQHSAFSVILGLQLLVCSGLYLTRKDEIKVFYAEMPFLKAGMTGMMYGALTAFLLNDSGVIAAALLLNYMLIPLVIQVTGMSSPVNTVGCQSNSQKEFNNA